MSERSDPTSGQTFDAAGELLRALASPMRIAIVTELAAGPRRVHELVEALRVPQPLVSQHLRVLRMAGLVDGARSGREVAYALTDEHVAHIVADAVTHAGELSRPRGDRPAAETTGHTGSPRGRVTGDRA